MTRESQAGAVAALFDTLTDGAVRCRLCPHACRIADGALGDCRTRQNVGGTLIALTYGRLLAAALDPIEKKPLFHYRPGSTTFSVASAGCNLVCPFCQNHTLSQEPRSPGFDAAVGRRWTPAAVVEAATESGAASIAFTYSEPILSLEFAEDVAALAKPRGLDIVFVTNGQATREAAGRLAGFVTAANVDLKSAHAASYKDVLGGSLAATQRTIDDLLAAGVWIELTTLVIPGFNDSEEELTELARYIRGLGPAVPWHVSRFHGAYRWRDRPSTPIATLQRAREIGLGAGLQYVYTGNLPGDAGEKSACAQCGATVVDRVGYQVLEIATRAGQCTTCGHAFAGMGLP